MQLVQKKLDELDAVKAENKSLKEKVKALEVQIANIVESDDSNVFELNQWIGEIKKLRMDLAALRMVNNARFCVLLKRQNRIMKEII